MKMRCYALMLTTALSAVEGHAQFVLAPIPVMIAGGANGAADYRLTYAYQAALLSDGRLATLATIGNKLLIFGADGRGQRVIGRTGQGPGEFMAVSGMFRMPGDTLFLPDGANNHRLSTRRCDGRTTACLRDWHASGLWQ